MLEKYGRRVVEVKHLAEASLMMNKEFKGRFPLPLRGILTSVGEPIDLHLTGYEFNPKGTKFTLRVKSIDELLKDGTELNIDRQDMGKYGIWTRVVYSENSGWAYAYAGDRTRAEQWANEAGLSDEQRKMLKPALLVYDTALLTKSDEANDLFAHRLPDDAELRSKAILKVYINNTPEVDLSEPPF